jgi:hypothetical protein
MPEEPLRILLDDVAADDDAIAYEFKLRGNVHSRDVTGQAYGVYSWQQNLFRGHMRMQPNFPMLGQGIIVSMSSCSIQCINCCINSVPTLGAVNLKSLFDSSYRAETDYSILDSQGQVIGKARTDGSAQIRESDRLTWVTGDIDIALELDKTWKLQPDLMVQHSPGYAIYFRQISPGRVEGHSAYPLILDSPEARGQVVMKRTYTYDTNRVLPFPEVQHYFLRELAMESGDDALIVNFAVSAYYTPLEPIRNNASTLVGAEAGV